MLLISSSMRVGSTWISNICSYFYNNENFLFTHSNGLEINKYYDSIKKYKLVKNHDLGIKGIEDLLNYKKLKIITITRDPKDAYVSFYWYLFSHREAIPQNSQEDSAIDDFKKQYKNIRDSKKINLFIKSKSGESFLENWQLYQGDFTHKNLLKISYEEMVENQLKFYKKIKSFLALKRKIDIEDAINKTSIQRKAKIFSSINKIEMYSSENFYRKGIVGDYKNYLTQESIDFINKKTGWIDSKPVL